MAAISADPRVMKPEERESLMRKLVEVDSSLLLSLEEEVMDCYDTTLARLKFAGLEVEWPIKRVYIPIKNFQREK